MTELSKAWEFAFDMMHHANSRPYRHRATAELALEIYFEEIEKQLLPLPAEKKP